MASSVKFILQNSVLSNAMVERIFTSEQIQEGIRMFFSDPSWKSVPNVEGVLAKIIAHGYCERTAIDTDFILNTVREQAPGMNLKPYYSEIHTNPKKAIIPYLFNGELGNGMEFTRAVICTELFHERCLEMSPFIATLVRYDLIDYLPLTVDVALRVLERFEGFWKNQDRTNLLPIYNAYDRYFQRLNSMTHKCVIPLEIAHKVARFVQDFEVLDAIESRGIYFRLPIVGYAVICKLLFFGDDVSNNSLFSYQEGVDLLIRSHREKTYRKRVIEINEYNARTFSEKWTLLTGLEVRFANDISFITTEDINLYNPLQIYFHCVREPGNNFIHVFRFNYDDINYIVSTHPPTNPFTQIAIGNDDFVRMRGFRDSLRNFSENYSTSWSETAENFLEALLFSYGTEGKTPLVAPFLKLYSTQTYISIFSKCKYDEKIAQDLSEYGFYRLSRMVDLEKSTASRILFPEDQGDSSDSENSDDSDSEEDYPDDDDNDDGLLDGEGEDEYNQDDEDILDQIDGLLDGFFDHDDLAVNPNVYRTPTGSRIYAPYTNTTPFTPHETHDTFIPSGRFRPSGPLSMRRRALFQ